METSLGQAAISNQEASVSEREHSVVSEPLLVTIPVPNSLPAYDPHFIQNQLLKAKSNPPKDKKIVIALTVLCFILSVASLAGTHWSEEESWEGQRKDHNSLLVKYTEYNPEEVNSWGVNLDCEDYLNSPDYDDPDNGECVDNVLFYHESFSNICKTSQGHEIYVTAMCKTSTAGIVGTVGVAIGAISSLVLCVPFMNSKLPTQVRKIMRWVPGVSILVGVILWFILLPGGEPAMPLTRTYGLTMWLAIIGGVCAIIAGVINSGPKEKGEI